MNDQVQAELKKIFNGRFSTSVSTRTNYARGEDTYDPILSKAVVFPETKELVINSFENDKDYLIVVDILTGELLSKVDVNARLANGMFLTPGFNRDIFYCTTGTFAKVTWQ